MWAALPPVSRAALLARHAGATGWEEVPPSEVSAAFTLQPTAVQRAAGHGRAELPWDKAAVVADALVGAKRPMTLASLRGALLLRGAYPLDHPDEAGRKENEARGKLLQGLHRRGARPGAPPALRAMAAHGDTLLTRASLEVKSANRRAPSRFFNRVLDLPVPLQAVLVAAFSRLVELECLEMLQQGRADTGIVSLEGGLGAGGLTTEAVPPETIAVHTDAAAESAAHGRGGMVGITPTTFRQYQVDRGMGWAAAVTLLLALHPARREAEVAARKALGLPPLRSPPKGRAEMEAVQAQLRALPPPLPGSPRASQARASQGAAGGGEEEADEVVKPAQKRGRGSQEAEEEEEEEEEGEE